MRYPEGSPNPDLFGLFRSIGKFFLPTPPPKTPTMEEMVLAKMEEDIKFLHDRYGLIIDTGGYSDADKPHINSCRVIDESEAPIRIRAVMEEIAKYPPEYIEACRTETIRLLQEARSNSYCLGKNVLIGGKAIAGGGLVYISANAPLSYMRRTVHHELFHQSDASYIANVPNIPVLGGIIRRSKKAVYCYLWEMLNPDTDFRYAGDQYQHLPANKLAEMSRLGFARQYGLADDREDRATIAELVMTDLGALRDRADHDSVLNKKTGIILRLMRERSRGRMNNGYFNDLMNGRVTEDYWFGNQAI